MTFLRNFWKDEQGQDLIEYTLLMAFVALASSALFLGAGGIIKVIWTTTNSQLTRTTTKSKTTPGGSPAHPCRPASARMSGRLGAGRRKSAAQIESPPPKGVDCLVSKAERGMA